MNSNFSLTYDIFHDFSVTVVQYIHVSDHLNDNCTKRNQNTNAYVQCHSLWSLLCTYVIDNLLNGSENRFTRHATH